MKEEFLTLLPLKTTMKGVDIYDAVKKYVIDKNMPLEKLVLVTTDGAPAMTGRHTGFVVLCRGDLDFPKFLHYTSIIHQQAMCAKVMGFDHIMTPVVKIINSIQSKENQDRSYFLRSSQLNMKPVASHLNSLAEQRKDFAVFFCSFE